MTASSTESSAHLNALGAEPSEANALYRGAEFELDACLSELAQLAQTDISERDFYATLLSRIVGLLAAVGGAAWRMDHDGSRTLIAQVRFPRPLSELPRPPLSPLGSRGLGEPIVLPPFARANARLPCDHPHPWPLIVCTIERASQSQVVIEVALECEASVDVQSGAARVLHVMADIAGDFQRRSELTQLRERNAHHVRLKDLLTRLHSALDPKQTASAIANDGRIWIGCDRVSVVQIKQGRGVALAISCVDHIDRRSAQVTALEQLSAAVATSGESIRWNDANHDARNGARDDRTSDELPPQLAGVLHEYLDLGHARQLMAIPLPVATADPLPQPSPPAVLIAESFGTDQPFDALAARADDLARMSGLALHNALTHAALPLLSTQKKLATAARVISQRPVWAILGLTAAVLAVLLLAIVPADFVVEANGELQPKRRRNLFAPADGVVEVVRVQHGERVSQGQELLRIRSPVLDLDESRLNGELQTAQARLLAIRSAHSRSRASDAAADENQLASEEEQVKQQIAGIEAQLSVLRQFRSELTVVSPLTGVVLSWNTQELLADRPVKQGQVLLTVADTSGPWNLQLLIADGDAGHVVAGQNEDTPLPVTFLLASDPAATHQAHLERVAMATDTREGVSGVEAIVATDGPLPKSARAGSRVMARIHCGQQSLGYVWLHDLIDFARTTFWY
jgi:multidrug efflux pump subunit AcrA (membrane-fusion protein)